MSISGAMENFKKLPGKQVIMMYKASRAVWCPGEQRDSKVLNTPMQTPLAISSKTKFTHC